MARCAAPGEPFPVKKTKKNFPFPPSFVGRARPYVLILLAGLMVTQLYTPAWAQYNLSEKSVEEDLGLVKPEEEPKEFPDPAKIFHFDQNLWNRARDAVIEGRPPDQPKEKPEVVVSSEPAKLPSEEEPGIEVELPYESGLSISGRKLISVSLRQERYKSAKRAAELGVSREKREFSMKQELQVRIKGKVGRKITVNVDFDDTRDDKRDISVVYTGDPEEVVQEAAFGDITLSLPSTRFVGYSKQLFGVRAKLKYKQFEFMAIGSRTKGVTETKRFTGNKIFERKEILDTSYVRSAFYTITFDPAFPPIEQTEEVWLDDRIPTNDLSLSTTTAVGFGVGGSTYTGHFELLSRGRDYVVDYQKGVISFYKRKGALPTNHVVAVDYLYNDGGVIKRLSSLNADPTNLTILKGDGDDSREIKTFYDIGRTKIVRDDRLGNFLLKTMDLNGVDFVVNLKDGAALKYPDNIFVDFEGGLFNIEPPSTFTRVADDGLYKPTPDPSKFKFLVEYRYRQNRFQVRPNIVLGSERVVVNGRILTRDLDYFMDYDLGFIEFINEEEVDDATQIEVTYEYAPFGGQLGQTLVGTRLQYNTIPDKLFVGSTFLYTFAPKPTAIPDIRATPNSLMVIEADGKMGGFKIPFTPFSLTTIEGEVAQSRENPNLFGNALVESMEGIKEEDTLVLDQRFWIYGSNPADGSGRKITRPSTLSISDETMALKDINPNAQVEESQRQKVLNLGFNFDAANSTATVVQAISTSGRDFSRKLYLNLWVQGAGAQAGKEADLVVDAGEFNEDSDGDGALDTEDGNRDGSLNQGEDAGWDYNFPTDGVITNPIQETVKIGAENGRIDTEDLDADGTFDGTDASVGFTPLFRLSDGVTVNNGVTMVNPANNTTVSETSLAYDGWRFIQVEISSANMNAERIQRVKQVRLTLTGVSKTGAIRIGNISFEGNKWKDMVVSPGSTMTLSAVNNFDNPGYESLLNNGAYKDIYKDDNRERVREQALSMKFDLVAGSSATTKEVYGTARDFSRHNALRFFVRRVSPAKVPGYNQPSGNEVFFMQIGNETDYWEYAVPMGTTHMDNWVLEGANLVDLNNDSIPDVLEPMGVNATVTRVGNPVLTSIGQLKLGVRNDSGASTNATGEIWVNEIHLSGARLKVGNAHRMAVGLGWDRWGSFAGEFSKIDRNFQTLTSQVTNQDRRDRSGTLSFSRIPILPLTFSGSKSETFTPQATRTGEAGLVSVLKEGHQLTYNLSGNGSLLIPRFPALGFSYRQSVNDSNVAVETNAPPKRDEENSYRGTLDYAFPWQPDIAPGSFFTFRPLPERLSLGYTRTIRLVTYDHDKNPELFNVSNASGTQQLNIFNFARTITTTQELSGSTGFTFWDGFSLSPTYRLSRDSEQRRFTEEELQLFPQFNDAKAYDKRLSQAIGLTGSLRVLRWLEPRFSYNIQGTETNNPPSASSPTAFNLKTIDRSASGDVSWNFSVNQLLPRFKPVQSLNLNNRYEISDGDSYENVAKEDRSWQKTYWVRNGLDLTNGEARRRQLTKRDTLTSGASWSPLDWTNLSGRMLPFKSLNGSANYRFSKEQTEFTATPSRTRSTTWPDLVFSMRDWEHLFGSQRFMDNTQWNLRYNKRKTENVGKNLLLNKEMNTDYRFTLWRRYNFFLTYGQTSRRDLDLLVNMINNVGKGYRYSSQVGMIFGAWSITPNQTFVTDKAKDRTGKITQDATTKGYSVAARFDKAYPNGLRLPFSKRTFGNINRFTFDTKLSLNQRRSSLSVESSNTDTYGWTVNGEYEISRNFRLSFGGGAGLVRNKVRKEDGLMTLEINSTLVIQF